MNHPNRISPWILSTVAASSLLLATLAAAQVQPARPAAPSAKPAVPMPAANAQVPNEKELVATQAELIKLLRLSPKLTTVIEHDPSLLANQEYVNANNPQLGQFLASHPEIARNPEFYLFTHMNGSDVTPDEALDRAVWPEIHQQYHEESAAQRLAHDLMPLLGFACFLGALIWLIRALLENRRWSRIFKLQSEVHGKLIDKFSSSQELAAYMETEAGKRFLEAAPIPVGFEPEQRVPNAVARVLTPLQIGIVLTLLGLGCYLLRHVSTDMKTPMLVFGTLALMPGLGFIISAGITWVLAGRLGLMPQSSKAHSNDRDRQ
jgi:flagellar biogenesis protein FliO